MALVILQECQILTLLPMVVERGKASSGTQKADIMVELSPILVLDPTRTGLNRPSTTAPKPTQQSLAMATLPQTVALGAMWAEAERASEYWSMLTILRWRLMGQRQAISLVRMDPLLSRVSPTYLTSLPSPFFMQGPVARNTLQLNRSKFIIYLLCTTNDRERMFV